MRDDALRRPLLALLLVLTPSLGLAQEPASVPSVPATTATSLTPLQILERVDDNISTDARRALSRMVVYNHRGEQRVLRMQSWVVGTTKAFSEYLEPVKEKGTKMLKVDRNLWTYSPRANRVIHIAGHLLRQPVMGSDLSYEDSLEETRLALDYEPTSTEVGVFEGRPVWVMTITARRDDVAYATKKLWIDQDRFLPLRQEWFGKSGKLLKTATVKVVKRLEGRWYPTTMLFKDELKSGRGTEFIIDEVEFNPPMPERIFSKESLRR